MDIYVVSAGDSIDHIAETYGTSAEADDFPSGTDYWQLMRWWWTNLLLFHDRFRT